MIELTNEKLLNYRMIIWITTVMEFFPGYRRVEVPVLHFIIFSRVLGKRITAKVLQRLYFEGAAQIDLIERMISSLKNFILCCQWFDIRCFVRQFARNLDQWTKVVRFHWKIEFVFFDALNAILILHGWPRTPTWMN